MEESRIRAPRNRTIVLTDTEQTEYAERLVTLNKPIKQADIENKTIYQDNSQAIQYLPDGFVDLLFLDPPYNLTKTFNTSVFVKSSTEQYKEWFQRWFVKLIRLLKPTASVYICGDWRMSSVIQEIAGEYLTIQNRITWEREKGRGAKSNWKNCSEDIWFCTVSSNYTFNAEAVKLKRLVIAPYKDEDGNPKDWDETESGSFRLTYPSNLWTDLTVPFWSMAENTDHPTQKPEKLLAKIILASTQPNDFILDPFLGSGSTSVVAKKLGRRYCGIEIDRTYCCLAEKRLSLANNNGSIQGYAEGVFWERNTQTYRTGKGNSNNNPDRASNLALFDHE